MSIAELKLELIREIDKLSSKRLEGLLQQLRRESVAQDQTNRRFGALKGMLVYMSPDFDAPLEDFKDYM